MNEGDFFRQLAKVLNSEDTFDEIERKKQKERRMLESLGAHLGVEVDLKKEEIKIPSKFVKTAEDVGSEIAPVVVEEIKPQDGLVVENVVQPMPELPLKDIVNATVEKIAATPPPQIQKVVDEIPNSIRKELDILKKSVTDFHRFAQRHSQMAGGGEVNLRWLDDVDRNTIADGYYLRYDEVKRKFVFDEVTGAGPQGYQGNQGIQGYQGAQGHQGVTGPQGTGGTIANYGSFYDVQTQIAANTNTAYPVYLRTNGDYSGVSIVSNTRVKVTSHGTYDLQFSLQLHNTGGGGNGATVVIWLRKNGVDLPDTATNVTVNTNSPFIVAAWNFVYPLIVDDYLELMWSTDNANIIIEALPASGISPLVPSAIVTMTQVTYTQIGPQGAQGAQGVTPTNISGTANNANHLGAVAASSYVVKGPAFSAYANNTTQTIPTDIQTKILFQVEEFDTNSSYDNSTFTPNAAGYYQLNAEVRMNGSSGTGEMMIVILKNGIEYKRGQNQQGVSIGGGLWAMGVSSLVLANGTTDYFEIAIQHGAGSDRTITTANSPAITWFNGCLVRSS